MAPDRNITASKTGNCFEGFVHCKLIDHKDDAMKGRSKHPNQQGHTKDIKDSAEKQLKRMISHPAGTPFRTREKATKNARVGVIQSLDLPVECVGEPICGDLSKEGTKSKFKKNRELKVEHSFKTMKDKPITNRVGGAIFLGGCLAKLG